MEGGGEKNKGVVVAVVKTPDKSKRDEWSEGGIMSLLDVYETKWSLRNRAKLKGSDWEEIAGQVSARNCGTKPGKTPNQCKNKIEAMKKRYRMELAVNNHSGWQFYARMDGLVKGTHCLEHKVGDVVANGVTETEGLQALPNLVGDLETDTKRVDDNGPTHVQIVEKAQNYKTVDESGQNHVQVVKKAQNCNTIVERGQNHVQDDNQDDASDTVPNNSEFSTPRNKAARVADRSLKARMEMYRDSERLRVEADIKRAEMDLKRTEIVAKTQLQIAKLLVKRTCNHNNKSGNSSLVGEHNVATNPEERSG
ncbi:trihelix transcription factor ASIL2-like isoform X2 [Camellia sinensis]|uniref:trihelix transcription factor ASIL2-like isoform X2 n=1 Tax=Camellia sinensis TaxID=4442 RepID=UPI001035C7AB|nr:trihelix transcription factor ASIL2-like isoform X2 [Camellia sinensis]